VQPAVSPPTRLLEDFELGPPGSKAFRTGARSLEQFDFARPRLIRALRRRSALVRGIRRGLCRLTGSLFFLWLAAVAHALVSADPAPVVVGTVLLVSGPLLTVAASALERRETALAADIERLRAEHRALTGAEPPG